MLTARRETRYSQLESVLGDLYRTLPKEEVGEEEEQVQHVEYRVSQALEALGHCNFDFEEDRSDVFIRPPSLGRLPVAGEATAILTGARSSKTIPLLASKCQEIAPEELRPSVEKSSEELSFIPIRVEIQSRTEDHLGQLADETGITYHSEPPALQIADSLGTTDEYLQSLPEPKTGEPKNWEGRREYFPEIFRFRKKKSEEDGLRLVRYRDPHTGQPRFFLFRGRKRQEVDREWGRYAVLRETYLRPLVFDRQKMLVAIPEGARLPSLHSRALSMCSGYAPEFIETSQLAIKSRFQTSRPEQFGYHVYRWVDPRVIRTVAQSLDQNILEARIEL
ncbi:hypothetical protein GGP53_001025 [Salinibacter ruber]|uniref:hypothetical protein n=1 Tax=Salinibacter ruber TaxID=146919 RepID=UPI00216A5B66|nr:hypothetical protein [Salinibacter ruber]MCS3627184.1 hypothetical protein [Salinibacter ruber]MCS4144091.1 hypothetical protein [Salinibacter ruber]